MSTWAAKRFWTKAHVTAVEGGYELRLDARPLKTPAKAPLTLPSRALAEAIAAEWDAQDKQIDPRSMPLTRMANSALDKVAPNFAAVAEDLAGYGGTDLLCYRAEAPEALVLRQQAEWGPLLDWAAGQGARLTVTMGVAPVPQPPEALAALAAPLWAASPFELAALHDLIGLSGSLVIGLAVAQGRLTPQEGWRLSRIDEDFQAEVWGLDEEAAEAAEAKRRAFDDAHRFWDLLHITAA